MTHAPRNGRTANEQGFSRDACPFQQIVHRELWLQEWDDAQIDRELWEKDTTYRVQLPPPGSQEASAMIDSVLAEYNYPSNPKNAARAGYEAARRLAKAQG